MQRGWENLILFRKGKLPLILQAENTECGLACLAMVAGFYGYHTDLVTLRRRFRISMRGLDLLVMSEIAQNLNLEARPVKAPLADISYLRLPCILHWDMNHFVVLKKVRKKYVTVHDPASGERRISLNDLSASYTGVAVELWPNNNFSVATDKAPRLTLISMLRSVSNLLPIVGQIFAVAVAVQMFALLTPIFSQLIFDEVLVARDFGLLTTLAIGFLLATFIQQILNTTRSWMELYLSTLWGIQWKSSVLSHMMKLPYEYFMKRRLGDVVSRFSGVETVQRTLSTSFLTTTLDGITAIGALGMMLLYGSKLVPITLGAVGLYILLRIIRYFPLYEASVQQAVAGARQSTHFLESVRGIKAVKLFNRESVRRIGWMALTVDQTNASIRAQRMMFLFQAANNLLANAERILVLWAGAYMIMNKQITAGALIAYLMYKDQFSSRVGGLIDKYYDLKILRVQLDRLSDIVLSQPEEDSGPKRAVNLEEPTIRLEQVHFRYGDGDPEVLRGIDCEFRYGEHVAIVGPSGCGKTTLMHILAGIVRPRSGRLLINGEEIHKIGITNCRRLFGTVSQDDCLFAGTLYQNICFFDDNPDLEWAEECARRSAIHDDIMKMPMRYETEVGDMGSVLSGGQKQRILLARALYKRPSVLILDEATSHLNIELEQEVNTCIKALGMTRIVIAHRPDTIAAAGRVIRLENGEIADAEGRAPNAEDRWSNEKQSEEAKMGVEVF